METPSRVLYRAEHLFFSRGWKVSDHRSHDRMSPSRTSQCRMSGHTRRRLPEKDPGAQKKKSSGDKNCNENMTGSNGTFVFP